MKVDDAEQIVLCRIAGFMHRYHIKVTPGDRALVELCPADLSHGRIVRRL